ncbi:calmodulin [Tothia fuscella]|uniref:Calmodulin n=1 Tax=Tothia fuscella TaxID=1048955 RepID=A0A9P4NYL7_9PEZI|nr:calmodulin [Tothia fuscella]
MAPKRRAPPAASAPPAKRLSKLAKENHITNEQELEIREAFSLFSVEVEEFDNEKEGVLKTDDVRRCLVALGVTVKKSQLPSLMDTLDPMDSGFVTFGPFLSYAAIHMQQEDQEVQQGYIQEVQDSYNLFTANKPGPITLVHLRRICALLKEEVDDQLLKDMLAEANGEGREGWRRGVNLDAFEDVMRRAGVFG